MNIDFVSLISTLGFPIVACVCMAWFIKYIMDGYAKERRENMETISRNTEVMQELINVIKNGGNTNGIK